NTENSPQQSETKAPFRGFGGKNPYKSGGMFEGASHIIFGNAKHLRKNMTDAEKVLWFYLKKGIEGFKFRRQHPIGLYIADFYCHKAKLIVEIDGSIHNQKDVKNADETRQKELEGWGHQVIRFTNQQVITQADRVIASTTKTLTDIFNNRKQNASSKDGV
ncbi:MAG: endonuclease domain-containing protein, partial [Chitinophagaceae bacterium]